MTTNDWQSRLLSDDELQHLLATLGALEGMQVLQRQLELRSNSHEASSQLREEVSSHPELGLTDVVHIIDAPIPTKPEPQVSAPGGDIAGNLNALFANRQQVSFDPVIPLAISETPRSVPDLPIANQAYNPVPLESNTNSFFIPTFSNPLPGTESIEVVTPMVDTVDPAKVSSSRAEEEPVPTAETPIASPTTLPVAEWESTLEPALEIPSAEEALTAFEEAGTTSTALPNLVDEVILSVGGELDESHEIELIEPALTGAQTSTSQAKDSHQEELSPKSKRVKTGLGKLIATWNGTGNLLFLIAAGFATASMHFSLATVLVGAFGALSVTGFGFGTAALSAKRGAQPQATLSRAAFGYVLPQFRLYW